MNNQKEAIFSVETVPLDVVIHSHSDGESTAPRISTDRSTYRLASSSCNHNRSRVGRKERRKQGSHNPAKKKARHRERGHEVQHKRSSSDSSFVPPLKCSQPSSTLQKARLQGFDSVSSREDSLDNLGRESCMVASEKEELGPAAMTVKVSGEREEKEFCQSADNAGSEAGDEGIKWQRNSHTAVAIVYNDSSKTAKGIISGTCNNNNRLMDNRSEKDEAEMNCKRSTSSERGTSKQDRESNLPISCDIPLEVCSSHMRTVRVFYKSADGDTEVCNTGLESGMHRDIATCSKMAKESGNVVCDVTEIQQEANSDEATPVCVYENIVLHSNEFVDKGACSYNAITSYSRIEACVNKHVTSETCSNVIGIILPSHELQHFIVRLSVSAIKLTVTYTKPLIIPPSMIKSHPNTSTCCIEHLVNPEQESQFGYESHLDGGVMVNGHTLISNVSVMLMGSLRGDKASKSHNYSGCGSLRSKSGLEKFCDNHNEATFASFRENRHANYAQSSYRAEIVGGSNLAGAYSESDAAQKPLDHKQTSHIMITQDQKPVAGHVSAMLPENTDVLKPKPDVTAMTKSTGYNKPTYPVLIGNYVRVYLTKLFAILPCHSKFMVKERLPSNSGMARVKLTLKCSNLPESNNIVNEDLLPGNEAEDYGKPVHFRENCRNPGYVIYTCDGNFSGTIKYPLPSGKATDSKIGKGGNGFVFTIYHQRKKYAAKKTVYRANEVNVHAALRHENILPLVAVLMGERHEHHKSKFYCFHFMPVMDCDLRQILSTREVGCLRHFFTNCSKEPGRWETGFNNIKFILGETLKALIYLHDNGYVHRDVKASNIMIKMQCRCQPLSCRCSSKFQVKLGDFDSAGTVPGLGIKEPTDQMIKFASILPLGTPGYRAPEVSMHITLSGPYETLYTFAVDMWSFGCLCLNICIGKTAALRQREEASLLLSRTHPCSTELWEKTTKIKELEKAKPFIHEKALINLIRSCLQVNGGERPSARDALKAFKLG